MNAIHHKQILRNEQGFTLVEVIAVLIILGILAAVAVPKYIDLEGHAKDRAIDAAISELNGREGIAWAKIKIDPKAGYPVCADEDACDTYDQLVWAAMLNKDSKLMLNAEDSADAEKLGYKWDVGPDRKTGGELSFRENKPATKLIRTRSTSEKPGSWKRDTT